MENQKCVRELGLVPGTCTEGTGQQAFASQQARHKLGHRCSKGFVPIELCRAMGTDVHVLAELGFKLSLPDETRDDPLNSNFS